MNVSVKRICCQDFCQIDMPDRTTALIQYSYQLSSSLSCRPLYPFLAFSQSCSTFISSLLTPAQEDEHFRVREVQYDSGQGIGNRNVIMQVFFFFFFFSLSLSLSIYIFLFFSPSFFFLLSYLYLFCLSSFSFLSFSRLVIQTVSSSINLLSIFCSLYPLFNVPVLNLAFILFHLIWGP